MRKVLCFILLISMITYGATALAGVGTMHYVKPLQANVYESSSEESKVKFIIAIGRKVVEFDEKNGMIWCGIDKAGGRDGWIKLSDLSSTDPDGMTY